MGYSKAEVKKLMSQINQFNGALGAAARNKRLSPERRSEIARKAARARWAKARGIALVVLALLLAAPLAAKPPAHHAPPASKCASCPRDAHGKIARSESAREQFMRQTGYPHGRPGYVIDHIIPLACGGADVPSNLQWQSTADAKAKDKTERQGCTR